MSKTKSTASNSKGKKKKSTAVSNKKEISTETVEETKKDSSKNLSNDPVVEKKASNDTTSISVISTRELNHLIEEDLVEREKIIKPKKHLFTHFVLIITMIVSLISFGITLFNKDSSVLSILTHLLITIFTILFVVVSITYKRNHKSMILVSSLLLIVYFFLQLNSELSLIQSPISTTPNFSGKSIMDVIQWADKNKIKITQEYEYSDMIPEYSVISQSIPVGTTLSDIESLVVSVSEGPNPSKEIMVPSMIGWDTERVISFIHDNYLSHVEVEFEQSDKEKDTVISQSASGSLKRDDELKLSFSYGEELGYEEVSLIDFTNKSEFEVTFYMKQHQLNYSFDYDYDKAIKKGFAKGQSIQPGEMVPVHDKTVGVTISKGPEIKVPDFTKFSMTDVAEWAIQNKVKINFDDQYDDTIKENHILKANFKEGDIIEQGTIVKITLSRGSLKMSKFSQLSDFYDWANRYSIHYEEKHEFNDTIPQGEVISYSYKPGEVIKNGDTIIVTISDGSKKTVPNLLGLTRKEVISKLASVGLKYSFSYRNSSEAKDKVLSQSIRSGSEISEGTTISVILSNGKTETSHNNNSNNNNNGNNNNSGGNSSSTPTPNPTPTPEPEKPTCNSCSFRSAQITSTLQQYNTYETAANGLRSYLQERCPGLTVNISGKAEDGYDPGDYISGYIGGETDSCSTISIVLAK